MTQPPPTPTTHPTHTEAVADATASSMRRVSMSSLEAKIEELAKDWETKAEYAKKYAAMPKGSGINATQMLSSMAHYQVSANALRRVLSEYRDAGGAK